MVLSEILHNFELVKLNLTIRQGILLLLIVFGLIVGGVTFFTVRYFWSLNVEKEYFDDRDDLIILARQIETSLDDGDDEPFRFVETTAVIQAEDENFSFMLRDSTGIVVSPPFMAGKEIPINDFKACTKDGCAGLAKVWGYDCFVVFHHLSHHPYELVAVYDYEYVFGDDAETLRTFALQMLLIFMAVALLTWFWLTPMLESSFERRQRAEDELRVAHDLQLKAVTHDFEKDPQFDIHAELRAMKDVGGDSYLCGRVGKKLFLAIADVSDKGTAAAFMMFLISSVIRSRIQSGISLDTMMGEVNRLICDNPEYEMFCTMFMGTIDPDTLEMEYCNAGHTRTLVDGEFLDQDPQLIVGINPEFIWHTQKMQLHHGAHLLLYTDGVTEARSEDRSFFGEKRLQAWMQARPKDSTCFDDCADLLETLAVFRGTAMQNDDIAIMSIKIL